MATVPGSSLQNFARAVCIIDITLVAIPLTFETITVAYFLGLLDPFKHLQDDCDRDNCPSWIYTLYREFSRQSTSFGYNTIVVVILLIFVLMGAIVEGYLFAMLRRGIREQVHYWVKKWFRLRMGLLLLTLLGSLGKYLRSHYDPWQDGLADVVKGYRVMELCIVRCYMAQLERIFGTVYVPPLQKPKKGSLGQELGLLI